MNCLERGAIISECKCIKILHSFSGTLTAAIPVALLNPGLGFRKKRSLVDDEVRKASIIMESLTKSRPS